MTIVDRVSKLTLTKRVAGKHAEAVAAATISLPGPYRGRALTVPQIMAKSSRGTKK